ncbi:MAG TPA: L,D-transpeptidase, partial [Acidimicrobiia bacterium]|nr:L,D-transpeptidase [Acidimicrobiia bacterium]
MRLTTYLVLLAALVALPAARIGGLIGGHDPSVAATVARATPTLPTVPPTPPAPPAPAATPTTEPPPVAPVTYVPTVGYVPSLVWTTADVRPSGVEVYNDPTASTPTMLVTGQTEFGTPRVLPVIGQQGTWLEVRLPVRPNNAAGWIKSSDVAVGAVADKILVSLTDRELSWYHGQTLDLQTTVGIGSPSSPTPPGEYYITDVLPS